MFFFTYSDKISAVDCTVNGSECSDSNSACDTQTTKCKCNNGFQEDSHDGSTCVQSPSQGTSTKSK